uniref:R3H domain-containing protein n=1 Tax=Esox lucius TaxID=8010 RepID=A0A3P8X8Z2_ESOLU
MYSHTHSQSYSCTYSSTCPGNHKVCCTEREETNRSHYMGSESDIKCLRNWCAKGRLVRSTAVYEDVSIPSYADTKTTVPTLIVSDTSQEYTDSSGIDLHQFIIATLNSNPRDRMMLLKLEQEMIDFITDNGPYKKFPHMSSYHRMLVHRVAAYFGMEHNVDQTGKSVIINTTSNTRIPEQRFMDYINDEKGDETQWRSILKRDHTDDNQARFHTLLEEKRSKSMEEREEEYQRARERIFNQELYCVMVLISQLCVCVCVSCRGTRGNSGSSRHSSTETDYSRYSNWSSTDSGRYSNDPRPWSSTDSGRYSNDPRPWSSTDSDSSYQRPNPAPMARSTNHSSNYLMEPIKNGIPPGSILLNPHTGQPFLNPDGTPAIYHPQQQAPPHPPQQAPPLPPQQAPPLPPQQAPPLPPQQASHNPQGEELSSQFGCMNVSCQSAGEAPPLFPPLAPPTQSFVYTANPHPINPHSYCQPPPTQVGTTLHQNQYNRTMMGYNTQSASFATKELSCSLIQRDSFSCLDVKCP